MQRCRARVGMRRQRGYAALNKRKEHAALQMTRPNLDLVRAHTFQGRRLASLDKRKGHYNRRNDPPAECRADKCHSARTSAPLGNKVAITQRKDVVNRKKEDVVTPNDAEAKRSEREMSFWPNAGAAPRLLIP